MLTVVVGGGDGDVQGCVGSASVAAGRVAHFFPSGDRPSLVQHSAVEQLLCIGRVITVYYI